MIVVTGATGHLGNVLVRSLVAQGETTVRAVTGRSGRTESLAGLDVEMVEAGLHDYDSLLRAFRGATVVYHVAGVVSIETKGLDRLRVVNVEGTRNVLAACREAGVGRLVYTSSIHALVEPPAGVCLDESFAIDPEGVRGPYARTKAEATRLVFAAADDGLATVVVFPSGVIGPYDFRLSHTGKFIKECAEGRFRVYVDGAYNFVDVRDVAQGLIAAAQRGHRGEGYLLTGHELSVVGLVRTIESISGLPGPRWRLPTGFTRAVSHIMPAYYRIRREQPLFTTYSLDVIASNCQMTSEKAQREIGFHPRPLRETLEDTIGWYRQADRQASPEWLRLPAAATSTSRPVRL